MACLKFSYITIPDREFPSRKLGDGKTEGCLSRIMVFRMVRNLRIQAVSATFFSLPRFNNCWYWERIKGLCRVATKVAL